MRTVYDEVADALESSRPDDGRERREGDVKGFQRGDSRHRILTVERAGERKVRWDLRFIRDVRRVYERCVQLFGPRRDDRAD